MTKWSGLDVIVGFPPRLFSEENLDVEDGQWEDIHVLTGALKLFLRELPEPLFPFSFFDKFIAAIRQSRISTRLHKCAVSCATLP